MRIKLNMIDNVKLFTKTATELQMENVMLKSGRHTVPSTSIMGIFSLDLTKPIEIEEESMTPEQKKVIQEKFENIIL